MGRETELIEKAISDTGLNDFGDDGYREGLEILIRSIDEEADVNAMGRMALDAQITDLLAQRLKVQDCLKHNPEIHDEEIVAPLVGIGLPRTGSTALACLLGEDRNTRSLRNWEMFAPTPAPGLHPESVTPRIAMAEAVMERRAKLFPRMQQMLPSTPTSPTECQSLMGQDFKSQIFQAFVYIPSYVDWLNNKADLKPTYEHVKTVFKILQHKRPPNRWRIKNPSHSMFIRDFSAVFPDARYVMTHRDVAQVIPSVVSLYHELSHVYSDNVVPEKLAEMNIETWSVAMQRMISFRDDEGHDGAFFDIAFKSFMKDPFPWLERLYAFLGEDLTEETRAHMQHWRENTPRDKHGEHTYDPESYGIDVDALRKRFGFYFARFPGS